MTILQGPLSALQQQFQRENSRRSGWSFGIAPQPHSRIKLLKYQ
jgi:hypothetical protein